MPIRGIRGAIDVARNTRREIFHRTQELLRAMIRANRIRKENVAAAFFTLTPDLDADFPAYAARDIGWKHVPMMCASEIPVPGAMKRVLRILLLVDTYQTPEEIRHQYLGRTAVLRPDLAHPARSPRPGGRSRR